MRLSDIDNMLSLIALAILADDHVHQVEIDVFATVAQHLPKISQSAKPMNEFDLRAWYEENKVRLFKALNSPDFNIWLSKSIDRVSDSEEQRAILLAMEAISKSDENFHIYEKSLISFLSDRWNIQIPLGKIASTII